MNITKAEFGNYVWKNPKILIEMIENCPEKVKYIVLDEVQKIPKLLDLIHRYIFKHKKEKLFVLTGSSARKLKKGAANLLAGRAFIYHLFPLTFVELGNDFNLDQYLRYGGLRMGRTSGEKT